MLSLWQFNQMNAWRVGLLGLFLVQSSAFGFALLGPYEPWMTKTNGFRQAGDIGGPMNLGNEYRWNVPVVTYGFDKSFLDYFGSNGVAAVEQAIQIINDLPSASNIVLSNYPTNTRHANSQASNLYDLKSATLSLLLEQMGLAQPSRNVFVLRTWDPWLTNCFTPFNAETLFDSLIPGVILERNFDPETLEPTHYVDGTLYSGYVNAHPVRNDWNAVASSDLVEFPVDPLAESFNAVADNRFPGYYSYVFPYPYGDFYLGLTRDDVGGLRYLLEPTNVNYENLLPSVHGAATNSDSFVNGALRPGVGKITFVPHPFESELGEWLPWTNQFTDTYVTNGHVLHQQLERVISQPDFLFVADDIPETYGLLTRTGTSSWINSCSVEGVPLTPGPGVIQPPVRITFKKAGQIIDMYDDGESDSHFLSWGSFDNSTNAPVVYPILQTGTHDLVIHARMYTDNGLDDSHFRFDWKLSSQIGTRYLFQTSTNLSDWTTLGVVTNTGSVCEVSPGRPTELRRFFRVLPQEN